MNTLTNSKALTKHIRQALEAAGGTTSFATFMEMALYHPAWGYYQQPDIDIGKEGDFTTAPEISPLFAKCIARQCADLFKQLPQRIFELGAGSGRLACDLLLALDELGITIEHYYIFEISPALCKKQQALINTHCAHLANRVTWLEKLPIDFSGVILANEVLDALPVHCFLIEDTIKERCITWKEDQFVWQATAPTSAELNHEVTRLRHTYQLANGYESEINLHLNDFISNLAHCLKQGVILFFDYGYGEREYYHPERRQGTLTSFYQHQRANPLQFPGAQDITAHVNFTAVIQIAAAQGCALLGHTTQAAFLLACGLLELAQTVENNLAPADQVNLHHAIKLLTFPTEMGERVKVMALGKGMVDTRLMGFALQDRRREL